MAKDYSEDLLIQQSTAELLEKELGWKSVYAFDSEVLGEHGTLGRKSQHDVVLTRHLRLALKRLNAWMTDKQLAEAIERMTGYMSLQTLMQINEEKYGYLRDGVPVTWESYSEESISYYRDTIYNYVSQRYGGVA